MKYMYKYILNHNYECDKIYPTMYYIKILIKYNFTNHKHSLLNSTPLTKCRLIGYC